MTATDDAICNCLAARQAARQLTQLYDDALSATGLRVTQFSVLAWLSRMQPSTMHELAEALVLDRTTLSHNLKPLERDGLVAIEVDGDDQRVRRLRLTVAGKRRLAEARAAWTRVQRRFEAAYGGVAAARALRRTLARAVEAAR